MKTIYYNLPTTDEDRERVIIINARNGLGFSIHNIRGDVTDGLGFDRNEMNQYCAKGKAERITRYQAESIVGREAVRKYLKKLHA